VLYAGAHGLSNDLTVLLEAADRLRDVESLAFVLVGDGKEKPNLVHQSLEMGLTNIFFISPVPKDQIPEVLGASDVCIAILKPIELYKTVYPNKVFDYMAAGRPIVLAIDGVIREVIETAQAGIAVPPGNPGRLADAIQMYQEKPQVGKTHGDNGRQYVRSHFERKILSRQMLDILLKTLENYQ
jgi:glycosyltransferase involved in cell wall biosynthesis